MTDAQTTTMMMMGQPPVVAPVPGALREHDRSGDGSHRRNSVIDRLVAFNHRHAGLAWEHRRSQPACPHGIAYLYREPGIGGSPFERIHAATAVFDADDDSVEVARLLYRLIGVGEGYRTRGLFDPARQMAIFRDQPSQPGVAELFGVAVSTLDTQTASWGEQQRAAQDESDLGGRCVILLAERPPANHGLIVVERGAPRQHRFDLIIRSTVDLSFRLGMSHRDWHPVTSRAELLVDDEVWRLLLRLHLTAFEQNPRPRL